MTAKPSRWEASAARANERQAAKAPLFAHAGLTPVVTAEEQEARVERMNAEQRARWAELAERQTAQAAQHRALVAAQVTPEELAALDARRAMIPKSPEYSADFWYCEARLRGLIERADAALWAEVERLEAEAAARAPAPAPPAEQLGLELDRLGQRIAVEPPRLRVAEGDDVAAEEEAAAAEAPPAARRLP